MKDDAFYFRLTRALKFDILRFKLSKLNMKLKNGEIDKEKARLLADSHYKELSTWLNEIL